MILNNILLNNGLSSVNSFRLFDTLTIEVNLWDEPVIPWNMRRYLSWAYGKFIDFVFLYLRLEVKNISWVMTSLSEWVSKLSLPSSSGGAVSLSIDGPEWASRLNFILIVNGVDNSIISGLPMCARTDIFGNSFTSIGQRHLSECSTVTTNTLIHCWFHSCIYLISS